LLASYRKISLRPPPFPRRRQNIEFVQVRHEESAAFMACAHAKFTGTVGVCAATTGWWSSFASYSPFSRWQRRNFLAALLKGEVAWKDLLRASIRELTARSCYAPDAGRCRR
jgi:hypothetical protein